MQADYITEAERFGGGHERRCQADFCDNEPEGNTAFCEECWNDFCEYKDEMED